MLKSLKKKKKKHDIIPSKFGSLVACQAVRVYLQVFLIFPITRNSSHKLHAEKKGGNLSFFNIPLFSAVFVLLPEY